MDMQIVSFGHWLRERRQILDWSQSELARAVGCAVVTIRKLEAGSRHPSREFAQRLADVLGLLSDERQAFLAAALITYDQIPPTPSPVRRHNLPSLPSPCVGRDEELAYLRQLIANPECHLISIVGAGGIGKTHLALHCAAKHIERFRDGVYFVAIGEIGLEYLVAAIADALQLRFYEAGTPRDQLLHYMHNRHLLLVLDSFDATVPDDKLLVDIISVAPEVTIIVTSRKYLNLYAEWTIELHGLKFPDKDVSPQEIEEYAAARVFLQRARQQNADFVWTPTDVHCIREICKLVDGVPLALEFAATWTRMLSCREIADAIRRLPDFLASDTRDLPERHRSMRAVFEYSWQQLTPDMQDALSKLAVFRGGFLSEVAATVTGVSLVTLRRLREHCMIHRNTAGWYELHDLVRQFVSEKLAASPETQIAAHEAHCRFYAGMLEELSRGQQAIGESAFLAQFSYELENIRSAWHWALTNRRIDLVSQMIYSFYMYYDLRCLFPEAYRQFGDALTLLNSPDIPPVYDLHVCYLIALWRMGHYQEGRVMFYSLLSTLQENGLHQSRSFAFLKAFGAMHVLMMGDREQAAVYLREGLELSLQLDDHAVLLVPSAYNNLATALIALDRYNEAHEVLQQCVEYCHEHGVPFGTGFALLILGDIALKSGDISGAEHLYQECQNMFHQHDMQWGEALALSRLGKIQLQQLRHELCRTYLLHGLEMAMEIGAAPVLLSIFEDIARLMIAESRNKQAYQLLRYMLYHPSIWDSTRENACEMLGMLTELEPVPPESFSGNGSGIRSLIHFADTLKSYLVAPQ